MATVTPMSVGLRKGKAKVEVLLVVELLIYGDGCEAVVFGRLFEGSVDELLILIPGECEAV